MLQYILNASAIWLVSIAVYDLFLKKETHFAYNRAYLILTFLAGILLPMWEWSNSSVVYASDISRRLIQNATTVKQGISESTQNMPFDWDDYLLCIYCAGVAIALVLFIADVVKLVIYYKNGIKSKDGKWVIMQTSRAHAPFSLFHYLFVSNREQYTEAQWEIIIRHETEHARSFHFADQLLFQIGKIIFWFHPFVYIYTNRLLMLHEYQADQKSAADAHVYGSFLLEQALLQSAPAISHSFNRSPVKSRILMLARQSPLLSRLKYIIIVPLIGICVLLCTQNAFSYDRKRVGDTIRYRGNTITMKTIRDTVILLDPVTGKDITKVASIQLLSKFNGEHIYQDNDNVGISYDRNALLVQKILANASGTLQKLPDGSYQIYIGSVIFDKRGRLAYYELPTFNRYLNKGGVVYYSKPEEKDWAEKQVKQGAFSQAVYQPEIDENLKKQIINKVSNLLDTRPEVKPIILNGEGVPYRNDIEINFAIKGHQLI